MDCDDNTLAFERNYEFLGVAFRGDIRQMQCCECGLTLLFMVAGLPDKKLFPSVSAVYGNTEVSMVYLGPPLDG